MLPRFMASRWHDRATGIGFLGDKERIPREPWVLLDQGLSGQSRVVARKLAVSRNDVSRFLRRSLIQVSSGTGSLR